MGSTLVVILAETRASQTTFAQFEKYILQAFDADLALCVADNEREDTGNAFYKRARYVWKSPEYEDWGDGIEALATTCRDDWRDIVHIPHRWLGGLKGEVQQPGSGAIQIYFRMFLKQCLLESRVHEKYERVVITRSDFFHGVPHVPLDLLDSRYIWVPHGEHYGGINDRHVICPSGLVLNLLSVGDELTRISPLEQARQMRGRKWNIERFLQFRYKQLGLHGKVRMYPYTMFTVREAGGHTSWSSGAFDPGLGVYIKYPKEYTSYRIALWLVGRKNWTMPKFRLFMGITRLRLTWTAIKRVIRNRAWE